MAFYTEVHPLLRVGAGLTAAGLLEVPPDAAATRLTDELEGAWGAEVARVGGDPAAASLLRAMWALYGRRYAAFYVYSAIRVAAMFGQALAMDNFLQMLGDAGATGGALAAAGGVLVAMTAVVVVSHHYFFHLTFIEAARWRVAFMGLILRKALRLTLPAQAAITAGFITNLASNDVAHLTSVSTHIGFLVVAPVEAVVAAALLWRTLGVASLAGWAALGVFIAIVSATTHLYGVWRAAATRVTDARVHLTRQIVAGLRVIKMYGWEVPFLRRLTAARATEMVAVRGIAVMRAVSQAFTVVFPYVVPAAAYLAAHAAGTPLPAATVFSSLVLFQLLQTEVAYFFPMGLEGAVNLRVILARMHRLLVLAEVPGSLSTLPPPPGAPAPPPAVHVVDARFEWGPVAAAGSAAAAVLAPVPAQRRPPQPTRTPASTPAVRSRPPSPPTRSVPPLFPGLESLPNDAVVLTLASPTRSVDDSPLGVPSPRGPAAGARTPLPPLPGSARASPPALVSARRDDGGGGTGSQSAVSGVRDVSFDGRPGDLVVVTGAIGTGKTTLLLGLLGEQAPAGGTVSVTGRVAYAPQTPVITTGSVRDNILWGRPWEPRAYAAALAGASLAADLAAFPAGDASALGDNGILVSGGQRARIGLARALYGDPEVLLLDDPLAAVDARVGAAILEALVSGGVRRRTITVLVTHSPAAARSATTLLALANGVASRIAPASTAAVAAVTAGVGSSGSGGDDGGAIATAAATSGGGDDGGAGSLIEREVVHTGQVTRSVYWRYFTAAGGIPALVVGGALLGAHVATNAVTQAWLGRLAAAGIGTPAAAGLATTYGGLAGAAVAASLVAAVFMFLGFARAGSSLHAAAASRLLRAQQTWIDVNPVGRILNRFSRDVGALDESLPFVLYEFLQAGAGVAATLVLVVVVSPVVAAVLPLLAYLFLRLRRVYLATSRVTRRLDAVSRSPVYSLLNECISADGMVAIRAFRAARTFASRFEAAMDANSRAVFSAITLSRWLGLWMDLLCLLLLAAAAAAAVATRAWLTPAYAGLLLSQILTTINNFQWVVRQSAEAENELISAERLLEYATALPVEAVDLSDDALRRSGSSTRAGRLLGAAPASSPPPPVWPRSGALVLRNVSLRYRDDLPLVLRGINLSLPAGAKVGIVGRSGSGKSSLFAALLRLVPVSSGTITLDARDTKGVSLSALRRGISMIPQDPLLFAGSLRFNLDPFDEHSDAACWAALAAVQLADWALARGGLGAPLREGGADASCGQRQCLCLARALLRRNPLLLADEVTANVDAATDGLIHAALATAFPFATVVVIAHRLATVADMDYVAVMDAGVVVQFGHPHDLATQPGPYADLLAAAARTADGALVAAPHPFLATSPPPPPPPPRAPPRTPL